MKTVPAPVLVLAVACLLSGCGSGDASGSVAPETDDPVAAARKVADPFAESIGKMWNEGWGPVAEVCRKGGTTDELRRVVELAEERGHGGGRRHQVEISFLRARPIVTPDSLILEYTFSRVASYGASRFILPVEVIRKGTEWKVSDVFLDSWTLASPRHVVECFFQSFRRGRDAWCWGCATRRWFHVSPWYFQHEGDEQLFSDAHYLAEASWWTRVEVVGESFSDDGNSAVVTAAFLDAWGATVKVRDYLVLRVPRGEGLPDGWLIDNEAECPGRWEQSYEDPVPEELRPRSEPES